MKQRILHSILDNDDELFDQFDAKTIIEKFCVETFHLKPNDFYIASGPDGYVVNIKKGRDVDIMVDADVQSLTNGMFTWGSINSMIITDNNYIEDCQDFPAIIDSLLIKSCNNFKSFQGRLGIANTLIVKDCPNLSSLEGFPSTCKSLDIITSPKLTSLKGLSKTVESIYIIDCPLKNLIGSPQKCKNFYLQSRTVDIPLNSLMGGPKVCDEFALYGLTHIKNLKGGPINCKTAYKVVGCGIENLEGMPMEVQTISLQGCSKLKSLKGAPTRCYELIIEDCSMKTLEGSPKLCHRILLLSCSDLTTLAGLSPKVNTLSAYGCTALSIEDYYKKDYPVEIVYNNTTYNKKPTNMFD